MLTASSSSLANLIDLIVKLNVDERKITTTTVDLTLPLTVDVHRRHKDYVSNLTQ